jgi:hypothetical protein
MSTKDQTQRADKAGSKSPFGKSTTEPLVVLPPQQAYPAMLIQQARVDPRSLAPAQVLQLQRTLGNQAVGSLLSGGGLGQALITPELPQRQSQVTPGTIQRIKIEENQVTEEVDPNKATVTYISRNTSEYQSLKQGVSETRARGFVLRVLQFIHDKELFEENPATWKDLTDTVDNLLKVAPTDNTLETIPIKDVMKLLKAKEKQEEKQQRLNALPGIKVGAINGAPHDQVKIDKENGGFRIHSPGMKIEGDVEIERIGSTGQLHIGWAQNVISAERILTLESAGEQWSEKIDTQANDVVTDGVLWYGIQLPSPSLLNKPVKSLSTRMYDTPTAPLNREITRPKGPWKLTGQDRFIAWLCALEGGKSPLIYVYYVVWNTVWDASGDTAANPIAGTNLKASVESQGEGQGPLTHVGSPTSFKAVKIVGKY